MLAYKQPAIFAAPIDSNKSLFLMRFQFSKYSESDLRLMASRLADDLVEGDIITLSGEIGSGKSVFARAIVQRLYGEDTIVPSPSFPIHLNYDDGNRELAHFDLYRIRHEDELIDLDFWITERRITIVEWPERTASLPSPRWEFKLEIDRENTELRLIELIAHGISDRVPEFIAKLETVNQPKDTLYD